LLQINLGPVDAIKKAKQFFHQQRLASFHTVIALLLSALLLSSCGFHLRSYGKNSSNIKAVSLDCPNTSSWEICHHLKLTLLLNDIEITENATFMLSISHMIQKSRVLSLQANASAAELGLSSEVTYSLISAQENEIKHTQSVSVNNSYRHESSALLAKDRERDELQLQLSQQIAEEIVRQITVLNPDNWFEPETSNNDISNNDISNNNNANKPLMDQ
jgi:outer membrane lipopolysaccharide assembly protein LptE/RlpB